jgi:hypothetical protein
MIFRQHLTGAVATLLTGFLVGNGTVAQTADGGNAALTLDQLQGNWGASFERRRLPFDISGSRIKFDFGPCRWLPFTVVEEREDKSVPEKAQRRLTIRVQGLKQKHACTEDEVMAFVIERGTCPAVKNPDVGPVKPCEAAIWVFRSFNEWKAHNAEGLRGEQALENEGRASLLIYFRGPNVFTAE